MFRGHGLRGFSNGWPFFESLGCLGRHAIIDCARCSGAGAITAAGASGVTGPLVARFSDDDILEPLELGCFGRYAAIDYVVFQRRVGFSPRGANHRAAIDHKNFQRLADENWRLAVDVVRHWFRGSLTAGERPWVAPCDRDLQRYYKLVPTTPGNPSFRARRGLHWP